MKVWELMAKLAECPAGADVNVGVGLTLNAAATVFEYEKGDGQVNIRSHEDVEVSCESGCTMMLSVLADDSEEEDE